METRWASTLLMIHCLIQLRPTIKEMAVCGNELLSMSKQQWKQAVELKGLLQEAFEVTKKLQFADCASGYFYRKWTGLCLYDEANGSLLASKIAKSMGKKEA
jgi:hypothetical protein